MSRRRYSDKDRATALAMLDANEGNVYKTAKQLNIPRVTLIEWINGRVSDDVSNLRQEKKRDMADMCEELARKQWARLSDDDRLNEARYSELNAGFGTCIDKMQLLRQLPTQIISNADKLTDEQIDRLAAGENPLDVLAGSGDSREGTAPPSLASDQIQ